MNDAKLVSKCNKLARLLAEADGFNTPAGTLFYLTGNPRAQGYWNLAAVATDFWRKCSVADAVTNLSDDFKSLEAK